MGTLTTWNVSFKLNEIGVVTSLWKVHGVCLTERVSIAFSGNHCDLNGKCIDRLWKEGFAVKFMLIKYTKLAPGKIRTLDGRRRPKELQTLMKLTCSIPDRTSFFLGTFLYFLKVFAYFRKKIVRKKTKIGLISLYTNTKLKLCFWFCPTFNSLIFKIVVTIYLTLQVLIEGDAVTFVQKEHTKYPP